MKPKLFQYEYPRPAVTTDVVAFGLASQRLSVLLIRRRHPPHAGAWAMPGGFLEIDEPSELGARRELKEETGLSLSGPFQPLGFYDTPGRDARGRTISLVYAAVTPQVADPAGSDDAAHAAWIPVAEAGPFAFDHALMLADGLAWLRRGILEGPLAFALLPTPFTRLQVAHLMDEARLADVQPAAWIRSHLAAGRLQALARKPREYLPR